MAKTSLAAQLAASVATASLLTAPALAGEELVVTARPIDPQLLEPRYGDIGAFWGDIEPFWGDIAPFWGDIGAFWGDVQPFWGDIGAFWGDIGAFEGELDPRWGDIGAFWGDIGAFWGDIGAFWVPTDGRAFSAEELAEVDARLIQMVSEAEAVFGPAIEARTGEAFEAAFLTPLLDRYGIVLGDSDTLSGLNDQARARFFLDFYDGLMAYSGRDRVDWWMGAIRWNPALTQAQNANHAPTVGLLDSRIRRGASTHGLVLRQSGYRDRGDTAASGHGTAIASLIAAPHDGTGAMGIAPNTDLLIHNPFDGTGTTNWRDVRRGIRRLRRQGAHVVNLSLGTEDAVLDQRWADVLSRQARGDVVFVKAAGNSALEAGDTYWREGQAIDSLLIVGSVSAGLELSAFSNRPGEGCLTTKAGCEQGHRVMDRFLVAPGELILIDDGEGGTRRLSGTSFSAPLVTGTVALLHSRWPWLERYAAETADIVLLSARDLGAPGVDPVYGHGLLDVEAAQSPLDWNRALFYAESPGLTGVGLAGVGLAGAGSVRDALLTPGLLDGLEEEVVLYAFEGVGRTFRDFSIPLKGQVSGEVATLAGGQPAQGYLAARLTDWAAGAGFAEPVTRTARRAGHGWRLTEGPAGSASTFLRADGLRLTAGTGVAAGYDATGSLLFAGQRDADPRTGGIAPLIGFASGGAFGGASMTAGDLGRVSLTVAMNDPQATRFGFTDDPVFGRPDTRGYEARTASLGLSREVGEAALSVSVQQLEEANGVLGTQGSGALSLGGGAVTRAVSAEALLPKLRGVELGLTATVGRTRSEGTDGLLSLAPEGASSAAYAMRMRRGDTFLDGDALTLTASRPLAAVAGDLVLRQLEVVDRLSGETAVMVTRASLVGEARHVFEADYALPVMSGRASALISHDTGRDDTRAGLSFRTRF